MVRMEVLGAPFKSAFQQFHGILFRAIASPPPSQKGSHLLLMSYEIVLLYLRTVLSLRTLLYSTISEATRTTPLTFPPRSTNPRSSILSAFLHLHPREGFNNTCISCLHGRDLITIICNGTRRTFNATCIESTFLSPKHLNQSSPSLSHSSSNCVLGHLGMR